MLGLRPLSTQILNKHGNKTFDEWVKDNYMIKLPFVGESPVKTIVNKVANSLNPFAKTTAEVALGKKLYPDMTKPSAIRDSGEYVAQSFGVGDEYRAVTGMPQKGIDKVVS